MRDSFRALLLALVVAGASAAPLPAAPDGTRTPASIASADRPPAPPDPAPPLRRVATPQEAFTEAVSSGSASAALAALVAPPAVGSQPWDPPLILTVPVPSNQDQRLLLDTVLASLQQAAADEGYLFDRAWLPWTPGTAPAASSKLCPDGAPCPGIVAFRRSGRTLATLVVGETPTSGVDRAALALAFDVHRAVAPEAPIRLVGPMYSGSTAGIRQALPDEAQVAAGAPRPIEIVSGSATSPSNAVTLARGDVGYRSMVTADDVTKDSLFRYLRRQGVPCDRIGFLYEGGTAYGQALAPGAATQGEDPGPRRRVPGCKDREIVAIPFPVDISGLRNAEEAGLVKTQTPRPDVPSLKKPLASSLGERGVDPARVPTFSPDTAAVQDTLLDEEFDTLRRHAVRVLLIGATSVFDRMYLASQARTRLPDTRVILLESNAVMQRPPDGLSLQGALVASTSPLRLPVHEWSGLTWQEHPYRAFASQAGEGVYNAVRVQLREAAGRGIDAASGWSPPEPSQVWLGMVGRERHLPLRRLAPDAGTGWRPSEVRPSLRPSTAWFLVLAGMGLFYLYGLRGAFLEGWTLLRRRPRAIRPGQDAVVFRQGHGAWLTGLAAVAGAMALIPWAGLLLPMFPGHLAPDSIIVVILVTALALAAWLLAALLLLGGRGGPGRVLRGTLATGLGLGMLAWYAWCARASLGVSLDDGAFFLLLRSLDPLDGASPLVPLGALTLAIVAWAVNETRILTATHALEHHADPASPLRHRPGRIERVVTAAGLVVLWLGCTRWLVQAPYASLESPLAGQGMLLLAALVLGLLVWNLLQTFYFMFFRLEPWLQGIAGAKELKALKALGTRIREEVPPSALLLADRAWIRALDRARAALGPKPEPNASDAVAHADQLHRCMRIIEKRVEIMTFGFVFYIVAIGFYPFQPHSALATWATILVALLLLVAGTTWWRLDHDPVFNALVGGRPDKVSASVAWRAASALAVPLLAVLGTRFPEVGHYLFFWINPLLGAIQ